MTYAKGRKYVSDTDYPIILESQRVENEMSIAAAATALIFSGIEWPSNFNEDKSSSTMAIDRDIRRAWVELGWLKAA